MIDIDALVSDREALEKLAKEHQLLKEVIEHSPAQFCVYDEADNLVIWNKAYEETHPKAFKKHRAKAENNKLKYAELVRCQLKDTVPSDQLEKAVNERVERQRNSDGTPVDHEYATKGWLRVTKFRAPSGAVVGMATNITELKELEIQLRESQRENEKQKVILQDAVETLEDGFVLYDKDDRLITFNEAYASQLGGHGSILVKGTTYAEQCLKFAHTGMIPGIEGKEDQFVEDQMKKRHSELGMEKTFQAHDGRWIRQRDKKSPSGNIVGLRTNVTELITAQQNAEAADRAKSEFLANMSHEIRTPMNGVMGMAELLLGSELTPKQKMFADMIVKSGSSLLTIINDILDFSKIDAGQLELDPAPFQLADAVEDVATLVSAHAAEKDLELIVRVAPSLPSAYKGDVGRIRQIITNLLGNAVKFTEKGHVYVNVTGNVLDNNMAELEFRIEDTGVGIPKDKCENIFDKFSQVDNSATRKHEGTGLGLSISSSLVELMGGKIGVESEVGAGSQFWFKINLPIEGQAKRKHRVPVDVTGARVLVIDDNAVNRSILAEQLEVWRFEHAEVASGPEGLEVMRRAAKHELNLDLVILDYQMPDMSGLDVLTEIRNDPALANLPVILLTSVDEAGTKSTIGNLKLEAHLTKPTRSSLMLETIIEVISETRGTLAPSRPSSLSDLAKQFGAETTDFQSDASSEPKQIESAPATKEQGEPAPEVAIKQPAPEPKLEQVVQETLAEEAPAVPVQETQPAPAPAPATTKSDLDILVAEDNEVNQMVLSQILETMDYSFKIVENGKLAVASWKVHKPALILMDVSMPEMNGHEATKAIRASEDGTGEHVTIVAVTAHALNGDRETCFDAGMDDYLPKPISLNALRDMVHKYLGAEEQKTGSSLRSA